MRRIVVAGASLAGVNAAQALREAGFDGEIVLVGQELHLPYDRPPLSKEALSRDALWAAAEPDGGPAPRAEADSLALRPAGWYAEQGIELRVSCRVVGLDPAGRTVTFGDGGQLGYDGLVIATGARPRPLPAALDAQGVLSLRRLEDADALGRALIPGVRVLVIGAGFIGLEVAATARTMGATVTVVEVAPVPLARALGEQVGEWLTTLHRANGVDLRCGQTVQNLHGGPGCYQARLGDGSSINCDVVVAAIGVLPDTDWLRGTGLQLRDGVCCDAYCRTSAPDIVAAGDVARWYNPLFDEEMRVEHWTNAVEQGRAAALSLLDLAAPAYAPVPYFWSDQFGVRIRFVGTAFAAAGTHIEQRPDGSLMALYQRDGLIRGALCIDAMRELPLRRRQILNQERWEDALGVATAARERLPD
jgi:NADPH-dependent 2,4-dienoyl-CoA reductase/sulfur reductase-like enzyme